MAALLVSYDAPAGPDRQRDAKIAEAIGLDPVESAHKYGGVRELVFELPEDDLEATGRRVVSRFPWARVNSRR